MDKISQSQPEKKPNITLRKDYAITRTFKEVQRSFHTNPNCNSGTYYIYHKKHYLHQNVILRPIYGMVNATLPCQKTYETKQQKHCPCRTKNDCCVAAKTNTFPSFLFRHIFCY